jgi:hypothetical protein
MASGFGGHRFRLVAVVAAACAFAAGAMLAAQPAAPTEHETFAAPALDGLPVDACLTKEGGCGLLSANAFCHSQGYEHATAWSSAPAAQTLIAGSGLICQTGPTLRCNSLRNVACTRPVPPPGSRTYAIPLANGAPVALCRTSSDDCGKAAADQFCRRQDFERASWWSWTNYKETWNIATGERCTASADRRCEGLRKVVCSGGVASRFKDVGGNHALPRLKSRIAAPVPVRIEDSSRAAGLPAGLTTTAWMGGSLEQMRQALPAERYGHLFADLAMAIAPYSRAARLPGVELPARFMGAAGAEPDRQAYDRFALADGPASVEAVAAQLRQLDTRLLTDNRVALLHELVAVFHKYQP